MPMQGPGRSGPQLCRTRSFTVERGYNAVEVINDIALNRA